MFSSIVVTTSDESSCTIVCTCAKRDIQRSSVCLRLVCGCSLFNARCSRSMQVIKARAVERWFMRRWRVARDKARTNKLPQPATPALFLAGMCQKWKEGTPAELGPRALPYTASAVQISWPTGDVACMIQQQHHKAKGRRTRLVWWSQGTYGFVLLDKSMQSDGGKREAWMQGEVYGTWISEATRRARRAMAIAARLSFSTRACFVSYSCVSKGSLLVRLPCEYLRRHAVFCHQHSR